MSKIAVFIDAENVDPNYAAQVFQCAEAQGEVVLKEIYGAGIALNEWAEPILRYALHMNLTLKPNKFKNSSDIALVIGAMDLLLSRARRAHQEYGDAAGRRGMEEELADTVLIASSDSDFSCLSLRLRTAGLRVIGMGSAEKTNPMWPKACTDFVPFNPLPQSPEAALPPAEPAPQSSAEIQIAAKKKEPPKPVLTEKVAASHTGRVEKVSAFIEERLKENGGRMTVSILFGFLNEMPDYRFDQRHSKRKPLDYLTRQYRDRFRFEEDSEGRQWIMNLPVTLLPQEPEPPEPETPTEEPPEQGFTTQGR